MKSVQLSMGLTSSSLIVLLMLLALVEAAPISSNPYYDYYNEFKDVPNDVLREFISCFGQTIMRSANDDLVNSKRTVDFGLARGYSGAQEAKHRMGLAAANFPGGPGRRRRAESQIFLIPN